MIFDNDTSSSTAIYTFSTTADTTSTANAVTDIYITTTYRNNLL